MTPKPKTPAITIVPRKRALTARLRSLVERAERAGLPSSATASVLGGLMAEAETRNKGKRRTA